MKISSRGTPEAAIAGADAALVAVGGGGVDVAVAGREGLLDRALGVVRRHLEDAEAELRDLDAVARAGRSGRRPRALSWMARPMAISGKASMKPMNRPIAAPDANVVVFERAPVHGADHGYEGGHADPIQKMEGIKSAPYRTDKPGGIHERPLKLPANERPPPPRTRN